jgi:phospholipase/carboxylesterase
MTEPLLPFEVVQPPDPKQVIIWLHGLGADGHDFIPMAHALNIPGLKWVFPHAPERSITINQGMLMRGWYDIESLDRLEPEDIRGLQTSRWQIRDLIEAERLQGFSLDNIMIGGFSQGGVMALYTGLSYEKPLKGIVALSCYLPMQKNFDEWRTPENQNTSIFMAHGHYDPILPHWLAQASVDHLKSCGYTVNWHDYPMGHQVCDEEIGEIRGFMQGPSSRAESV